MRPAVKLPPPPRLPLARRGILAVAGLAWLMMLLPSLYTRFTQVLPGLPNVFIGPEKRAELTSGDIFYHSFVRALSAAVPGREPVLLLVHDPSGRYVFYFYRAAYELYPREPFLVPLVTPVKTRASFPLSVDEEIAEVVRSRNIRTAAFFTAERSDPLAVYSISLAAGPRLLFKVLRGPYAPAPAPREGRALPWTAGLLVLVALGWAVLVLSGAERAFRRDIPVTLALSLVLGSGLMAVEMMWLSFGGIRWSLSLLCLPWLVPLAAAVWVRWRSPAADEVTGGTSVPWRMDTAGKWMAGLGLVLTAVSVAAPMGAWGNWDAWAIWGMKAKACLEALGVPFDFLRIKHYEFSNHEYPLGIPMIQSFLGMWAGTLDDRLMRVLSLAFGAAFVFIMARLMLTLGLSRGRWLAVGLFVLLPKTLDQAASGYTDLPLATVMMACALILVESGAGTVAAWTVGLVGVTAVMFKNEGLVWAGACLLTLAVRAMVRRKGFLQLIFAALVMATAAAPWRALVRDYDLRSRAFVVDPLQMIKNIPERAPVVIKAFMLETVGPGLALKRFAPGNLTTFGEWWEGKKASWLILWYAVLLGLAVRVRRLGEPGMRELVLVVLVQLAASCTVYFAFILNLPWSLTTSLDRLLFQVSPVAFAVAAAAGLSIFEDPLQQAPPGGPAPGKVPSSRKQ